jgi:hypothetical protein
MQRPKYRKERKNQPKQLKRRYQMEEVERFRVGRPTDIVGNSHVNAPERQGPKSYVMGTDKVF